MADEVKKRKARRRFLTGEPFSKEGWNWVYGQNMHRGLELMSKVEARKRKQACLGVVIYELVPVVP